MDQRKVLFQWYVFKKRLVMTLLSVSLHCLFLFEQSDSVTCLVNNTVRGNVFNVSVFPHENGELRSY